MTVRLTSFFKKSCRQSSKRSLRMVGFRPKHETEISSRSLTGPQPVCLVSWLLRKMRSRFLYQKKWVPKDGVNRTFFSFLPFPAVEIAFPLSSNSTIASSSALSSSNSRHKNHIREFKFVFATNRRDLFANDWFAIQDISMLYISSSIRTSAVDMR